MATAASDFALRAQMGSPLRPKTCVFGEASHCAARARLLLGAANGSVPLAAVRRVTASGFWLPRDWQTSIAGVCPGVHRSQPVKSAATVMVIMLDSAIADPQASPSQPNRRPQCMPNIEMLVVVAQARALARIAFENR